MRNLYREVNAHVQEMKQATAEGKIQLKTGIEKEMQRIKDTVSVTYKKGDYFSYEE